MMAGIAGTPYGDVRAFGEEHGDLVVYVEACEDDAFSICRCLHHLRYAGWFDHAVAVLVGRTDAPAGTEDGGLTQEEAVLDALGGLGVPLVLDMEIGHVPPHLPLLNGAAGAGGGGRRAARDHADVGARRLTRQSSWRSADPPDAIVGLHPSATGVSAMLSRRILARLLLAVALAVGLAAAPAFAGPAAAVEVLHDGGFEENSSGPGITTNPWWDGFDSEYPQGPLCRTDNYCGDGGGVATPRSGVGWVWLGHASTANQTGWVRQDFTIPAGYQATLSYWHRFPVVSAPFDATLTVSVDATVVATHSEPGADQAEYVRARGRRVCVRGRRPARAGVRLRQAQRPVARVDRPDHRRRLAGGRRPAAADVDHHHDRAGRPWPGR